jgi:hypothetical protein
LAIDRLWLVLGGGIILAVSITVLAIVLSAGNPPSSSERRPAGGSTNNGEEAQSRRNVPPKRRYSADAVPPAEVTPDFPETWVLKPEPIEGLKSWSIATADIGLTYPTAFDFTADARFLIRFQQLDRWMQFDPKTCGLVPAPFGGSYNALTENARMCARSVRDGVQLWEEGGLKEWVTLRSPGPLYVPAFSPDRKKVATFNTPNLQNSSELWFWNAEDGSKLAVCPLSSEVSASVFGWSPDSRTLAAGSDQGIALFQAPWTKCARTIARPVKVTGLAWSPDGGHLATTQVDNRAHVLAVASGKVMADIRAAGLKWRSTIPAWSPDGKEVALATEDKKVVIWDLAKNKATFTFRGHARQINAVGFLGDNKTLVSGSGGGVRFWDLEHYRLRGTLLNLSWGRWWVAIGSDGFFRASPDADTRLIFKVREENNRVRDFSAEDFHKLYAWKNRPERVKLMGQ